MAVSRQLEEFVQVPEGRIHFVKIGSGPPVVIFHPGGSSSLSWIPVMDIMGQHFTCYAFDILGHGQSDNPPKESFSIPDHGRCINQAMESLNINRAHFIGNLAGASLAIEMAASYPDRVDRLVLAVPPVVDPRTTPQRRAGLERLWDENGLPLAWDVEEMKAGRHFVNPKPEWIDQLNKERAQGGRWTRIHSTTNSWYDMVARLPIIKPTATLLINGGYVSYRDIENDIEDIFVYNLPNVSKVVVPGTGNFLYVEDPEGFASAVLDFLK